MSNKRLAAAVAAGTLALSAVGVANAGNPLNPVPGKPGDANIVQIAQFVNGNSGEFSYLLAAATCDFFDGAVVELLSGEDTYTLFAPTDAAFMAVLGQDPQGAKDPAAICKAFDDAEEDSVGTPDDLFAILAYHVTDGRRFSNSVFNRKATKMVEMLAGGYIVTNPDLTINDNKGQTVKVVPTVELTGGTEISAINVNASNGVIHTIDTVLLP